MNGTGEEEEADRRCRTVSRLISDTESGQAQRAEELLPLLYEELRALARARLAREAPGQTIQATVLVHEAYLRLVGDQDPGWNGRRHFFGAAALAMRRILVEQARRKARLRHGGGRAQADLDEEAVSAIEPPREDLVALDEALCRLETQDPRKGQIVNLRYFAGLNAQNTAEALGVSLGTVEREWRFIKAWLQEQLA